ncbi:cytochrome c oxidase assembly factor CtaG [Paenibacillus sp. L3-i20]|uniref:cytochrome c oxidase assembly factor CtaG n=1 Tax=Paenibacillus sp. L3-i20 TaxID=2905833 RepID=UPI001EDCA398|nr:cytochrome c oxidase assembly factor CtaG [Paenibacillus sp. L3-i20]GKU76126.1 cytochrome c oxidase assembly factor CtaG [Paenibacillus sp. L3-i20]
MLDLNKYFSFAELWTPMFLFAMIAVVILYFYLIGPWREKHFPTETKATAKQKWLFVGGIFLVYLCHGGPINLLGHLTFTYHMVNMSISYLVVPPMILLGLPAFVWRKVFSTNFWRKFRFLMNPIITLILFNMLFSFYHIPMVHDYVMTNFTVHRLYYVILFITSFMMWWQIACPVPEWSRLTDVKRMAYVFANGVLLTPACALIIFAPEALYATYSDPEVWATAMGYCMPGDTSYLVSEFGGPQFFNTMSIVEDQQLGGIVMKLVQELMYGVILVYIFKQWFKREHADDLPDPETA